MGLVGYSLVSADNVELQTFNSLPNPIRLPNGDDVHGATSGTVFSDGSRLLPVMRDDNSPGQWYKRLREERQVNASEVVVTVIYSDAPDIDDERAHMVCTPFQGRVALANAGMLAQVQTAVDAADDTTKLAWEYATEWRRLSPMITALASALSLSDTQVDDLFRSAMQISA